MLLFLGCVDAASTSKSSDPAASDPDPATPCAGVTLEEQRFLAQGGTASGTVTACTGHRIATAGAVDTVLSVEVTGDVRLDVTDAAGHVLGVGPTVQLWQSGEVLLDLTPPDDADHAYTVTVTCLEGCDRLYTRYPIVMMHGFGGAGTFDGVDYFYGVRDRLEGRGYLVRNPTVNPFATSQDRGVEWAAWLDGYMEEGLGRKFILLAHSQGGLDARWLVSGMGYGDRVAAVDMIGTPNHGTVVADVLGGTVQDGSVDPDIVDAGAAAFAALYGLDDSGSLTDNLLFLTTESIAAFNLDTPDDPEVYYASWAGITCGYTEGDCQDAHGGEVVEPLLDPLYLIQMIYDLPGDGMVDVDSAAWGDVRGTIDADHADEIGQFEDEDNPAFHHLAFYDAEIARLAAMGF